MASDDVTDAALSKEVKKEEKAFKTELKKDADSSDTWYEMKNLKKKEKKLKHEIWSIQD